MAEKTRAELKALFETNDIPTEANFSDNMDSFVNRQDDLKEYSTDPTVEDDDLQGFKKFDLWLNTAKNIFYFCYSTVTATAVWKGIMNIVSSPTNNHILVMDADGNAKDGGMTIAELNHNALTNTHNLTTDIDHNTLTNYSADRHNKQTVSTLDPTGIPEDGHLYLKVDA